MFSNALRWKERIGKYGTARDPYQQKRKSTHYRNWPTSRVKSNSFEAVEVRELQGAEAS